ncbi:MAG: hypothetical protein AB7F64_01290 [Gammaproteobacteria bacterium]
MKKINYLLILSFPILFTACNSMSNPYSLFSYGGEADSVYGSPSTSDYTDSNYNYGISGGSSGGGKPRPYSITPQDEANYQDLSQSLDQRIQQLNDSKIIKNSTSPSVASELNVDPPPATNSNDKPRRK